MQALAGRFYDLKTRIGGNREKYQFEYSFGMPLETLNHITLPPGYINRILGQLGFALQLSLSNDDTWDKDIAAALEMLEGCMKFQGSLTRAACTEAESKLLPLKAAAKEFTILCAAHSHIDMNWMWSWQETVAAALSTFRTMLALMDEYPSYTFSQSQAAVYHLVEQYDPEMMEEIKKRIVEGRWEVTASAWVETDKNMPCTESLLRHIRYTKDYLSSVWGVDPASLNIDFSPDTFGHSGNIPEIDNYGGVKYMYHCRGLEKRQVLYRWCSSSGGELLSYCEPFWYNSGISGDIALGVPELSALSGGLKTSLIVYGVGDHGGGPTRRDIERILDMRDWPVFPSVQFGTFREFFKAAETVRETLPLLNKEINFYSTGCYTTQSRIKMGNRHSEAALLDAENLDSLGSVLTGKHYPQEKFTQAWRRVLFTHFHDILTGSCVRDSREHAMGLFAEVMATAGTAREKQAQTLAANINTSMIVTDMAAGTQSEGAGAGYGLEGFRGVPGPERGRGKIRIFHVFNPSVHKRHELVEFTLWDWPWDLRRAQVTNHNGKNINFQLLDTELQKYWDHRFIRFLAEVEVPSMGYSTVVFKEAEMGKAYPFYFHPFPRSEPIHGEVVLENEFLRAEFDPETGGLFSLLDKEAHKELIAPGETGSLLLTWSEKETNNAWRIGRRLGHEKVTHTTGLKLFTGNALRNSLELEQEILNSKVKTVISLDKGARALSYRFNIAWNETAAIYDKIPVLCYALPLKDHADSYLADVPGGAAQRPEAFQDHPGLQYTAAVKGGDAVALVTDCKYGYRGYKDVLSVTLINTAQRPDLTPERGEHLISLWVTLGKNKPKELAEAAGDFCHPMAVVSGTSHPGTLMLEMELLGFKADSSVFCSATLDKSGSLLIRVNELEGKNDTISLRFPRIIKSAELADLDGKSLGILNSLDNELCFEVEPFRIQGVRIRF